MEVDELEDSDGRCSVLLRTERCFLNLLRGTRTPSAAEAYVVAQLKPFLMLLHQPGWSLRQATRGGRHLEFCRGLGLSQEKCIVVYLEMLDSDRWTPEDSEAFFVKVTSDCDSASSWPTLCIAVIPGQVTVRARNEGFQLRRRRVLPVPLAVLTSIDVSNLLIPTFNRVPKIVTRSTAMTAAGLSEKGLEALPIMRATDSALLWDVDAVIGSIVHCPPGFTDFRRVAPELE